MDFNELCSKIEILTFLPLKPLYNALILLSCSLITTFYPKFDILCELILFSEIVCQLSKYLQNNMFDIKILKGFVFYLLIFLAVNLLNPVLMVMHKIMPLCFTLKFGILLFLVVNKHQLLFLEKILIDLKIQNKKNTKQKIKNDLENLKHGAKEKINDLKED